MSLEERLVRQAFEGIQRLLVLLLGIAADVVIVDEVRGCHNVERCRRSLADVEPIAAPRCLAVRLEHHFAISLQACLDAFLVNTIDGGGEEAHLSVPSRDDLAQELKRQLACEVDAKRQGALLACLQLTDNDIVGKRGKDCPLVLYIIIYIGSGGCGIAEVQIALVVLHVLVPER